MTLLLWRRPSLAHYPGARLLDRSERAYWLAVGLVMGLTVGRLTLARSTQ